MGPTLCRVSQMPASSTWAQPMIGVVLYLNVSEALLLDIDRRERLLRESETIDRESAPDFLGLVRDLLLAVQGDPDGIVHQADDLVRQLKEQHAGFVPGKSQEDARRRLQNVRLATTHPDDRIAGLTAKKLALQENLASRLRDVVPCAVELACVEAELIEVLRLRDALEERRKAINTSRVYPEVREFADDLHAEHGITYKHFAALGPEERLAIARILLRR